jgi:hypothetical protein
VSSASVYDIPSFQPVLITLYRKDRSLPHGAGFYRSSNSTSTLHAHFTREGGEHYKYYREVCKRNNVPAVAKSPNVKEGNSISTQSDLSSFVIRTSSAPPFQCEGLLSYLCEWIALDNQVCTYLSFIPYPLITRFSVILRHREGVVQGAAQLPAPIHGPS